VFVRAHHGPSFPAKLTVFVLLAADCSKPSCSIALSRSKTVIGKLQKYVTAAF